MRSQSIDCLSVAQRPAPAGPRKFNPDRRGDRGRCPAEVLERTRSASLIDTPMPNHPDLQSGLNATSDVGPEPTVSDDIHPGRFVRGMLWALAFDLFIMAFAVTSWLVLR
jgi:hypothetical protein